MTALLLLITTFSDEVIATTVIRQLLSERLIGCGTIVPKVKSIYYWQGGIEESTEVMVFLKSTQILQEACLQRLNELHPYEVPEILCIEPTAALASYSDWIQNFTCHP